MSPSSSSSSSLVPVDNQDLHSTEGPKKDDGETEDGIIAELGYVVAYRRVFRSLGNMCMVLALTSPLSAILITATYQIQYAGYWGLSWGWIIPNALLLPEVLAIAELASSMPVNGSFYWWAGALAPPAWSHAVSFITGWMNVLTMFASTATFAYAVASSLSYGVTIALPDMIWTNAQVMALSLAVVLIWSAIMTLRLERIAFVYISMAVLILVQALMLIIGLPITHAIQNRPFASAQAVFGEYLNSSDWGPEVAVPYSWFCALWVNSAWMVPVYVSEETHNASKEIPKSLLYTFAATAASGLVVCLLFAFCIPDMEAVAADTSGYPLFTVVFDHLGEAASLTLFSIVVPVGFIGGSGTLLTYASQIAAFSRDGGFPWHERMAYIHPRLNLPIYALSLLGAGTFLVLIIALSPKASSIIYSLSVVSSLVTFIIPIFFRIVAGNRWVPGPWSLGRWSIPIHTLAVVTQLYLIIMECFPPERAWTAETFNYNFALTVGAFLIACGFYWGMGRKTYRGLDMEALEAWRRNHADLAGHPG
ncbi:hypothetical protein BO79DRAFT_275719 [Aspergillus costaricaensis CBS 115574]|uniref:Uncharacterized protein n=1 Tax=Aspergillus costaricaensis CBS 115574 TaxID=1448317 RepID=A0ACD1I2V2_9EURO|nr:hypothetical protein BO79DRAFT_275719 [Aspergillus costaricaensis CBS 115574]RAK84384.1 hypothetical protein BO79DRAFT_275719 [Aspergillus costaricaensis CBS 115574]